MKTWLVRTLVVAAVLGAFAAGRGLDANAEASPPTPEPGNGQFGCGIAEGVQQVSASLVSDCEPTRDFSVTYAPFKGRDALMYCCIRK